MLNEYFERVIPPIVDQHGGDVDRLIGDAIMVTFNGHGDQPDHAMRAARVGTDSAGPDHERLPTRTRTGHSSGSESTPARWQ